MQIGILITGHAPDALIGSTGDYDQFFARLLKDQGLTFRAYAVVDMVFPQSVTECDGWLLTGSRHGTYEDLPFIAPLETFVRNAYDAQVPMVGICFGHQIIAQALGGKVEKFDGGWSIGPTEYQFNDENVTLNAWHQDQVVELPKEAEVIGHSPFCRYAALAYDDWAFTVQAHPEFSSVFVDDLIRTRGRGLVPDAVLDQAQEQLSTAAIDDAKLAEQIANFFKKPRV